MVGGGGGSEAAMSPAASGGGKRGRDPEEEVYMDNLHSSKRYLSEIMASSLNGLSVGDSPADNPMESPARAESASCFSVPTIEGSQPGESMDEIIFQYSPMSEDSDDCRYYDAQLNINGSQTDAMSSPSSSPISSPHRFQKPHAGFSCANPYPLPSCSLSAVVCCHARRGSESEGRFPSSPNDMCHGADLRRTALLRSVQMRVQGPQAYDSSFGSGQEHEHEHIGSVEGEDRSLSCAKSIEDEAGYRSPEHEVDYIVDDCSSDDGLSESKFNQEKICSKF